MTPTAFRLFDSVGDGVQRALDLRQVQHTLSAANLANADTPGYHAREVPFGDLLGQAVDAAERGESTPASDDIREIDPVAWALDGNSVSPEVAFRNFRGRDVDTNALMRDRGFPVVT